MQEIVIKIPEEVRVAITSMGLLRIPDEMQKKVDRAIQNGTPLPKGHGRLIDADEYKEHLYACETNGRPLHIMELDERLATVDEAPTIIEADKESEVRDEQE